MTTEIEAHPRETLGKGYSRRIRLKDNIPAIVYGKGIENKSLTVNFRDIDKILKTRLGKNTFINLKVVGDKEYTVLIKTYQGDVLTRKPIHIDFWNVAKDQEVEINIAIKLEGKAPGLLMGGVLDIVSHSVKLICQASAIPEELVVNIGSLEVGQSIHLADVKLPEGVRSRKGYNPTIVSMTEERAEEIVAAPTVAAGAEAAAGEAKPATADATAGADKAAAGAAKPAAAGAAKSEEKKADDKKKSK